MRLPSALGLFAFAAYFPVSQAHQQHALPEVPAGANWATRHMVEEHHISSFSASSFFQIHALSSPGLWTPQTIENFYGLKHKSNKHVPAFRVAEIIAEVLRLFDANNDGFISEEEYVTGVSQGRELPDFGTGPGHHDDEESEYEKHHWERFHTEGESVEEEMAHEEDRRHYQEHEERERAEAELMQILLNKGVVERNIPDMFRVR